MFAASSAFAALSYDVTVDTDALKGSSGYIYMQFNANPDNTWAAKALVEQFATNGSLGARTDGIYSDSGQYAIGTLHENVPSNVAFFNTNPATNDYNQAINFGNYFRFTITLEQIEQSASSTFVMGLYQDALGLNPLKTQDGFLLTMNLNSDGTTKTTFNEPGTMVEPTPIPTPIPAAVWLLGSGLTGLAGIRRRKIGKFLRA
jgi:hypothetical protein